MTIRRGTPLLFLALALTACGVDGATCDEPASTTALAGDRVPIVVDYSPTTSDVAALMYVAQHPAADLLAVTLAGTGESHCEQGVANTRALLASLDLGDVPVACGRERPVGAGNEWPIEWREDADRLHGLDLAAAERAASSDENDAADLIASIARDHAPITIVAVAPLTNVAVAIGQHPNLPEHVSAMVTMGGAIAVEGNATNGSAEWNYYIDPTAVDIVLRSGIPMTIVALDATNDVPVSRAWFDSLAAHRTTTAANVVHDLFAASRPFDLGFFFWDELAAAAALDPSLVTIDEHPIVIELDGPEQGRTTVDATGTSVRIAVSVDRERFERELLTTLNGGVEPPAIAAASADEVTYFRAVEVAVADLSAAVEALFQTMPERKMEGIELRAESGDLTPEDGVVLRTFLTDFWTRASGHLTALRDGLGELDVPVSVRIEHDGYVAAVDSVIATRDEHVADIAARDTADLLTILWEPDDEIEAMIAACETLGSAASSLAVTAATCPQ